MKATSGLGLVIGAAGAAVLAYARRRGERTGRDTGAVLANLPGELAQSRQELERRLRRAMEVGRQAAAAKEAEIDRELAGKDPPVSRPPEDFM